MTDIISTVADQTAALRNEVRAIRDRGFGVCRLRSGQKRPLDKGWTTRSLEPDDFTAGDNVGLMAGWLSDGDKPGHVVVTIDIDDPAALALAASYLPPTGLVNGRPGKPKSHLSYLIPVGSIPIWAKNTAAGSAAAAHAAGLHPGTFSRSFKATDRSEMVRWVGNGQTVCPPSVHHSGERREWDGFGEPLVIDFMDLWERVCNLVLAAGGKLPKGCGVSGPVARPARTTPTTPLGGLSAPDPDDVDPEFDAPAEGLDLIGAAAAGGPITINGATYTAADRERRAAAYLRAIPDADLSRSGSGGHDRLFRVARVLANDFLVRDPEALRRIVEAFYNARLRQFSDEWSAEEIDHKIDDALNADLSAAFPPGCKLAGRRPDVLRNYREIAPPRDAHPDDPGVIHVGSTRREGVYEFRLSRGGKTITAETGNPMAGSTRKKIARAMGATPAQIFYLSESFRNDRQDTFPVDKLPTDLQADPAVSVGRVGRALPDIAKDAVALLGGNLRSTRDGRLFVVKPGPDGTADAAFTGPKPAGVFALIGAAVGGDSHAVDWAKGDTVPTKEEFAAALPGLVEQYDDVSRFPHHPAVDGIYYLNPLDRSQPASGVLDALVDRFAPETPTDRALIKAMFRTAVWGGPPGKRPAFLVRGPADDPEGGRGVGKSTLAETVGRLVGGYLAVDTSQGVGNLVTRLLSPAGQAARIVFWDNIKTTVLSSGEFEGLLTQERISGRRLYEGEGFRPNLLTYILTMNNGMLSKDMAQRCVTIRLRRVEFDSSWQGETEAMIDRNRPALFADAAAVIDRAAGMTVRPRSRWSVWQQHVLAGCCESPAHFADVETVMLARQAEEDSDGETTRAVIADVRELVRASGVDPDTGVKELPADWLVGATTRNAKATNADSRAQVLKLFNRIVGGAPEIVRRKSNGAVAYFWVGDDAPGAATLRNTASTQSELRNAIPHRPEVPATLPFRSA